jgi:hypothetical protein
LEGHDMPNDLDTYAQVSDSMLTYRVTPEQGRAAVRTICRLASNADDAREVIAALGLGDALASFR